MVEPNLYSRVMKRLLVCFAALFASCTTALVPQAEKIVTTRNLADVAQCKMVGAVEAHPPFTWPGDDLKTLKNKAAPLGADTVFVTNRAGTIVGVAYDCAHKNQ
jgi:hypothetical protein